jgi:hypothetical protein
MAKRFAVENIVHFLCRQTKCEWNINIRWLRENAGLTEENVLDYFALSEWFDKTCLTGQFMMNKKHLGGHIDRLNTITILELYDIRHHNNSEPNQLYNIRAHARGRAVR